MSASISVIIPVYNAERYLERCLESVFAQTYDDYKVIAVDDGSTDASADILERLAATHPGKLRIESQPNAGAAAARNRGIELAGGEYVCFIDNDDYIDPDYLETLHDAATASCAEIVCSGFRRPDAGGKVHVEVTLDPASEWSAFAVQAAWGKLFLARFVRRHSLSFLSLNISEDQHFTLPALACASTCAVIPYCGYNWFMNETSVSSTLHKHSSELQFEPALCGIASEVKRVGGAIDGLYLHYFARLVAWFLFYTGKGDTAQERRSNRRDLTRWLDDHVESWRNDPHARPSRPAGDALSSRVVTWLFVRHPVLFTCALELYVKLGKRNGADTR